MGNSMSATLESSSVDPSARNGSVDNSQASGLILNRIAAGDSTAVDDCVKRYGGLVWTLARRLARNYAEAEDAVQEIFVEIWQAAGKYDSEVASESTFITTIARRKLIDRYRRSRRGPESTAVEIAEIDLAWSPRTSELEIQDEAAKAAACFQKLTEKVQNVLRLAIHFDESHAEISKRLRLPLGTVKSFARRGLIQLRDCMQRPTPTLQEGAVS